MGVWVLGTVETEELVFWMRQYNLSHPEKVRFYGAFLNYSFDFQHLKDSISHFSEINVKLINSIACINEKYLRKKDNAPQQILKELKIQVDKFGNNIQEA